MNILSNLLYMRIEERIAALENPMHDISKKDWKRVVKAYASNYELGPWLSKSQKSYLSFVRQAVL